MSYGRKRSAILFMTHFLDGVVLSEYRKLRSQAGQLCDVWLVVNAGRNWDDRQVPEDVQMVKLRAIDFEALPYARSKRSLNSFNVDLFGLLFRRLHPEYERLWPMEYDVRFSGNWAKLFDTLLASPADLLGTTLARYPSSPGWENWDTLAAPVPLPDEHRLRGFFPFYGISAAALDALDAAYRAGWEGHFECTMPTIVNHAGLEIEDIGGVGEFVRPGNQNRFYTNRPENGDLGPGTFVFRPVFGQMGDEPNKLWHPVKPDASYGWATGRRARLIKAARLLLSFGQTG